MLTKLQLSLIGSSIVCLVGLLQNSTAAVIGSMAIAPLVEMILITLQKKSEQKIVKWGKLLLWTLVPILIGVIGQILQTKFYEPYVLKEKSEKKRTQELLKRTGQLKNILTGNAIIGVVCGGLLKLFPNDHVTLAGIAIALSLVPPLVASGMFTGLYFVDPHPDTPTNIKNALLLFITNVVSLVIGYKIASRMF